MKRTPNTHSLWNTQHPNTPIKKPGQQIILHSSIFVCLFINYLINWSKTPLAGSCCVIYCSSTQAKWRAVFINLSSLTHCWSRVPPPARELHYWSASVITLCVFAPPTHPSNNTKLSKTKIGYFDFFFYFPASLIKWQDDETQQRQTLIRCDSRQVAFFPFSVNSL